MNDQDSDFKKYKLINAYEDRWPHVKEQLEKAQEIEDLNTFHLIISSICKSADIKIPNKVIQPTLNFLGNIDEKLREVLKPLIHYIASLALRVEEYFPDGMLDILCNQTTDYTTYPSEQVACVIALGFFWCIPDGPKYADLNSPVNFLHWYTYQADVITEKMQFMLCYFAGFRKEEEQIKNSEVEPRVISFERLALPLPVSSILRYILTIL